MKMKIAVPLDTDNRVYHANPWTAPAFAIYLVEDEEDTIIYDCLEHKENPCIEKDESIICDSTVCSDGYSDMVKADLNHLSGHDIILEAVSGCSYMIAETYCSNVEKVLEKGGIEIYKLPPIVRDPDLAVKNLLVNLGFTTHAQKIKRAVNQSILHESI